MAKSSGNLQQITSQDQFNFFSFTVSGSHDYSLFLDQFLFLNLINNNVKTDWTLISD